MKQKISPKLPEKAQKDPYKKSYSLLSELKLKPKQVKFIVLYCAYNFDLKRAYVEAGYKSAREEHISINANEILKNPKVVEGMKLYLDNAFGPYMTALKKQLFDVWFVQAFYDPSMFYNPDGSIAFDDWKQIPEKYRICVESLGARYFGKDADMKTVELKLVNREWAQAQLDKFIGMTKDTKVIELGEISEDTQKKLAALFPGGKK